MLGERSREQGQPWQLYECSEPLRFVDLFAGLGGFHLALKSLGHRCVYASEIDPTLRDIYEKNFGLRPDGDIRDVAVEDIPSHDVLCAGFPCQPFSKAGSQDGFDDPVLGDLYRFILSTVCYHRPRYVILENVPNFRNHDKGKTWQTLRRHFENAGYDVRIEEFSPHDFGIPQIRDRVYIIASSVSLGSFSWPAVPEKKPEVSIKSVLDVKPCKARSLSSQVVQCLAVWQEFLRHVPKMEKIPHPLWSMEFGATYPYEETTPSQLSVEELRGFQGAHGASLEGAATLEDVLKLLPSHARVSQERFPAWKVQFIRKNREFYQRHETWLNRWIPKIREFPSSFQKLEWNCQAESDRRLSRYVLQMRASGVRVKRTTTAPSLIAMTSTQVPIITWERRYMTPIECKRLQSMEALDHLPASDTRSYEALGNAINVEVATRVAEQLVGRVEIATVPDPELSYVKGTIA